jgi:hypothetical protein
MEEQAREMIRLPGALFGIKAPQRMGKTSLLLRILHEAESSGYRVARINLRQAEGALLENLERFLRWFCVNLTQSLNLEPQLDEYWNPDLGHKVSCTTYVQNYLLAASERPLVIALDEVSHLFEYPQIANDFLPMLRFWHEEGKNLAIWGRLRLVYAQATDCYIPLNINQSPFNVGVSLQLPEFTDAQVLDLAHRYGLNWQAAEVSRLTAMIGGHPFLVQLAFYYLVRERLSLEQLIEQAPTQVGIYRDHLQAYLVTLRQNPELETAFTQVLKANEPIQIDTIAAYKLYRMGLVQLRKNSILPSCELIHRYYRDQVYRSEIENERS